MCLLGIIQSYVSSADTVVSYRCSNKSPTRHVRDKMTHNIRASHKINISMKYRDDMETFSPLLAFCERNTGGFSGQGVNNVEFSLLLAFKSRRTKIELPVIWDAMAL